MSGRRRQGRIRTTPARQRHQAAKATAAQREHGRPVPATLAALAAVPRLPASWLTAAWSDGGPFRLRKAQQRAERHARELARLA